MKAHRHELYNTETEQVEETAEMTSQEANRRNDEFWQAGEPRRWMVVRENEEEIDRASAPFAPRKHNIEPDGNILWA